MIEKVTVPTMNREIVLVCWSRVAIRCDETGLNMWRVRYLTGLSETEQIQLNSTGTDWLFERSINHH